jgi:tetratricopeptide (TPR) repeat protein
LEEDEGLRQGDSGLRRGNQVQSKRHEAYRARGWAWRGKRQYDKAIQDFEEAIRLDPKSFPPFALRDLAQLLATCPDEKVRDGRRAVELAARACDLSGWSNGIFLDSLAAAYAENGQFGEAVRFETKALDDSQFRRLEGTEARQHLELYKQKKPLRADD